MRVGTLGILLLGVVLVQPASGGLDAAAALKIRPWVVAATSGGAEAELLVVMEAQADLSGAVHLPGKVEKGRFVRDALWQLAEVSQASLRRWLDENGVAYRSFYIVNALWVKGDRRLVDALAERSDVARIEGNPWVHVVEPVELRASGVAPAGPDAVEWGIAKTNAPSLWSKGFTGQGIVVAGQDTGVVWTHEALQGKYRGWDGSAASHDYNWHDAIHEDSGSCGPDAVAPCDPYGHGTHTMGTIVGSAGSNQIGMAPDAKWIACRDMDSSGDGSPASYLECFEFFLAPYPVGGSSALGDPARAPDVTNNSWGCPTSEGCTSWDVLKAAVEAQKAAGIMTVVSAGNAGSDCFTVNDPPAIYGASYTVGATNSSNGLASFSSRGPAAMTGSPALLKPDVVAPGSSVRSAGNWIDNAYTTMSGTSMAAPHVAGAVALLWSAWPALRGDQDATGELLNRSALRLPGIVEGCGGDYVNGPNNSWGHGLIDVLAAFNANFDLRAAAVAVVDSVGDGNGVWEPAEGAVLETSWANHSSLPASAVTGHIGTAAAVTITDGSAAFGDIPVAGTQQCNDCYVVTATGPRPAQHWDVTIVETLSTGAAHEWVLHVGGSFTDISEDDVFYRFVETIFHHGITKGCTAETYCGQDVVTRVEMAAFVARSMAGGDGNVPTSGSVNGQPYSCGEGGHSVFSDVAPESLFCPHVHYIAAQNVTLGCTDEQFCPADPVPRWQMARFISRAVAGGDAGVPVSYEDLISGRSYSCSQTTPAIHFTDVPESDESCRHAHYLWAKGIIDGCEEYQFCPAPAVTRGQTAKFLANAFALQLYTP